MQKDQTKEAPSKNTTDKVVSIDDIVKELPITLLLRPLNFETLKIIFPYAFILASIGLIESLLTLNLVGEITNKRGGASQECLAQGLANSVTGFFGGMGGCAMIGQSMINVKSGGRTRISGITASLFLLLFEKSLHAETKSSSMISSSEPLLDVESKLFQIYWVGFIFLTFTLFSSCLLYTSPSPRDS